MYKCIKYFSIKKIIVLDITVRQINTRQNKLTIVCVGLSLKTWCLGYDAISILYISLYWKYHALVDGKRSNLLYMCKLLYVSKYIYTYIHAYTFIKVYRCVCIQGGDEQSSTCSITVHIFIHIYMNLVMATCWI